MLKSAVFVLKIGSLFFLLHRFRGLQVQLIPFYFSVWGGDCIFSSSKKQLLVGKRSCYLFIFSPLMCKKVVFCKDLGTWAIRVYHHFTLHLAPFYLAFSSKTHCVQHEFTLHLAAYCNAFWCIQHDYFLKTACFLAQISVFVTKKLFLKYLLVKYFYLKIDLCENRIFATA